ncbi:putative Tetratricopeptide repeat [Trypanosoma vivax]|nr:hypothetical protein TRVL_04677 [Trypanosoma vivax]KAH8606994.1 putative Tetratricopeptide repeat [Trypanosoma vivax]
MDGVDAREVLAQHDEDVAQDGFPEHQQPKEEEITIMSRTRKQYAVLPAASRNLLGKSDLKAIERYIELNRNHRFMDRDGAAPDVIPDVPFQRRYGGDESLQLAVKTFHSRESALDVPLRFLTPEYFHTPPLEDPPSHLPLSRRVVALLKGVESVPSRWVGRRPGASSMEGPGMAELKTLKDTISRTQSAVRAGDARDAAIQFCATASLHYNSGNMELARSFFNKALSAFEGVEDVRGIAFCHNILGVCHQHLHEYKVALLHHRKQEALGGCYSRAVAQINMGVCYGALGELGFAEDVLEDALANASACENSLLETIALGNQGLNYMRMGNMRAAQTRLEQCLEKCSLSGDKGGASICLLLLGEMYSLIQDHRHALFYYEHSFRVGGEAGCHDVVDVARVCIGISRGSDAFKEAVIQQAKRMGQRVELKEAVSLLPT